MKISTGDYAKLRDAIVQTITVCDSDVRQKTGYDSVVELYKAGCIPRFDSVKDLGKRFRWDMVIFTERMNPETLSFLYDAGMNDEHIDTALRKIMREQGIIFN